MTSAGGYGVYRGGDLPFCKQTFSTSEMAYRGARKYTSYTRKRASKGRVRPRRSGGWNRNRLDKYVEKKVRTAVKKASRGPARSVPVRLTPAHFERDSEIPNVVKLGQWTSYVQGASSERKYAILPITEAIPHQRGEKNGADDRYRSLDKVLVKGVSLRLSISHAEDARLMVFAFRNGARRDIPACLTTRPHCDAATLPPVSTKGNPPSNIVYDIMSKRQLMGLEGEGSFPLRNLGLHDGPFKLVNGVGGSLDWDSPDSTAFLSRTRSGEGGPVGTVFGKVDGGKERSLGRMCKKQFSSSSIMRTLGYNVQTPEMTGFVASKSHTVDLFIRLNQREDFTYPHGSSSVNERPLELFIGFDSPGPSSAAEQKVDVAAGGIIGAHMEIYYSEC